MANSLDEAERLLCEMIAQLQIQHQRQLQPLIERLASIRALRMEQVHSLELLHLDAP